MIIKILIPLLSIWIAGCTAEEPPAGKRDILDIVYSDNRTPSGFYNEQVPDGSFYATRHIRNNGYEVSASDYNEALVWDTASPGEIIEITETEWYYQFSHVGASPTFINQNRVFKSNIIDRVGVELNCDNCYQGLLNPEWASANNVKKLIEYIWMFTLANNNGNIVISSNVTENTIDYIVKMEFATLQLNEPECDIVHIYDIEYIIDKATGTIQKSTKLVNELSTTLWGTGPGSCTK